jgi:hypothetical protein
MGRPSRTVRRGDRMSHEQVVAFSASATTAPAAMAHITPGQNTIERATILSPVSSIGNVPDGSSKSLRMSRVLEKIIGIMPEFLYRSYLTCMAHSAVARTSTRTSTRREAIARTK